MSGTTNIPAVCVLIRKDDKLLFVKRAHTGYQDGKYTVPAGHVEDGESFRQAGIREVLEEVGLTIDPAQLRHVHTQHTYRADGPVRIHMFFEADAWSGVPKNMEPHVHSEMAWLPISDLPYDDIMDMVADGIRRGLAGEVYGEFGWPH